MTQYSDGDKKKLISSHLVSWTFVWTENLMALFYIFSITHISFHIFKYFCTLINLYSVVLIFVASSDLLCSSPPHKILARNFPGEFDFMTLIREFNINKINSYINSIDFCFLWLSVSFLMALDDSFFCFFLIFLMQLSYWKVFFSMFVC